MNIVGELCTTLLVLIIMSYGVGILMAGPVNGKKIVAWELKQLARFGRWLTKQVLRLIADACNYIHRRL